MSPERHFPGPLGAVFITMAALFTAVLVASLFGRRPNLGAIGIGQVIGFGLVAILSTARIAPPQSERIGLRGFAKRFIPLLVLLLPVVILTSELDNWIQAWLPAHEAAATAAAAAEETPGFYDWIERAIVVVGLAPVMEEWIFRGIILQGLVANLGRIPGITLTSMLFAMAHIGPGPEASAVLSYFMVAFLSGVLLGIVRLATGSLLAAMLVHAGVNLISISAALLADTLPIAGFNAEGPHTSVSILFPCAVAVGFALYELCIALRDQPGPIPIPVDDDTR